jgi:hypothetical protein
VDGAAVSRRAVTGAQIKRTVKAFEAMGKTVAGAVLRPDGSWEVVLTDSANASLPSAVQAEAEWDKAQGLR